MALSSLIHIPSLSNPSGDDVELDPADVFTSALGSIFTDDAQNMHGNPGAAIIYRASWPVPERVERRSDDNENGEGRHDGEDGEDGGIGGVETSSSSKVPSYVTSPTDILLHLSDPSPGRSQGLFAHYLWNASLLVAELVGRWGTGTEKRRQEDVVDSEKSSSKIGADASDVDTTTDPIPTFGPRTMSHSWSLHNETYLELGAGTGVAGISATIAGGAQTVAITDYPAEDILSTLRANVETNCRDRELTHKVNVYGHRWGHFVDEESNGNTKKKTEAEEEPIGAASGDVNEKANNHRSFSSPSKANLPPASSFTRIVAADCLWLGAEHKNLIKSMDYFLAQNDDARVWVVAGFHTGRRKVAAFFDEVEGRTDTETETESKSRSEARSESELGIESGTETIIETATMTTLTPIPHDEIAPDALKSNHVNNAHMNTPFEIDSIYEIDTNLREREWDRDREEGIGERNKWLVVAILRRRRRRRRK